MRTFRAYIDPLLCILAVVATVITLTVAATHGDHSDFILFWDAARWQFAGHDLYSAPYREGWVDLRPNLAAPALLILTVPLTLLPVHIGYVVWIGFGLACYALSAAWIGRELDIPMGRILGIFLICPTTAFSLLSGSFTAPLTLAVTRAWLEHRRGRDLTGGIWMGIALFCKPFLLPMIGYSLMRRQGLFIGLLAGMSVALVAGVVTFGYSNTVLWIQTLRTAENMVGLFPNGAWLGFLTRAGFMGNARLAYWLAGSLLVAAMLLWRWRRSARPNIDADWLATMAGGLLASPVSWFYYAPMLIGPFVGVRSAWLWIGYALFCLPWTTLIATETSPLSWRLTVGSTYFFAFALLFVASTAARSRSLATGPIIAATADHEGATRAKHKGHEEFSGDSR